ncbi:MAG: acyl-CoA dehydrogenase family protein [Chloroflexi bacterium]|nr:acyl-CoA dehydrogenase family protein [Chloroflexota bacterium]
MTDFALTETERMIKKVAHDFAVKEMAPRALEYDEREEFPWDIAKRGAALGLHGEPLAGPDLDEGIGSLIIGEELAWGCGGMALGMLAGGLAATAINLIGTEEQRDRFLPMALPHDDEFRIGALALTESESGSDAGKLKTIAKRDGDDYILYGQKRWITGGGIADLTVVFATEDPGMGWKGVSAFAVPKEAPGLEETHVWKKMGLRCSHTADLMLNEVRVPADHRLGPPDPEHRSGGRGALGTLTGTRPQIGIMALGIGRAAFEYAAVFAKMRQSFGKPIIEHQGVGFMLADMDIALDAARLLCWRAGWMLSRGEELTLEEASKAKAFASDAAMKVTTDAVQVLGGSGYMRDNPGEKWMRDAKVFQIFEGTNQIQRLTISRNIQERQF